MGAEISLSVQFSGYAACRFSEDNKGKKKQNKTNNDDLTHSCVHREKCIVSFSGMEMRFVMGVKWKPGVSTLEFLNLGNVWVWYLELVKCI